MSLEIHNSLTNPALEHIPKPSTTHLDVGFSVFLSIQSMLSWPGKHVSDKTGEGACREQGTEYGPDDVDSEGKYHPCLW